MTQTDLPFLPATSAEAPEVRGSELRSTVWLGSGVCECGAEMIQRKSGAMVCRATAEKYEVKYGQRLE